MTAHAGADMHTTEGVRSGEQPLSQSMSRPAAPLLCLSCLNPGEEREEGDSQDNKGDPYFFADIAQSIKDERE